MSATMARWLHNGQAIRKAGIFNYSPSETRTELRKTMNAWEFKQDGTPVAL